MPSRDPKASSVLSSLGENAIELTACPSSVEVFPAAMSHSRIVPSRDPEAISLPSGENDTEKTSLECSSSLVFALFSRRPTVELCRPEIRKRVAFYPHRERMRQNGSPAYALQGRWRFLSPHPIAQPCRPEIRKRVAVSHPHPEIGIQN